MQVLSKDRPLVQIGSTAKAGGIMPEGLAFARDMQALQSICMEPKCFISKSRGITGSCMCTDA